MHGLVYLKLGYQVAIQRTIRGHRITFVTCLVDVAFIN